MGVCVCVCMCARAPASRCLDVVCVCVCVRACVAIRTPINESRMFRLKTPSQPAGLSINQSVSYTVNLSVASEKNKPTRVSDNVSNLCARIQGGGVAHNRPPNLPPSFISIPIFPSAAAIACAINSITTDTYHPVLSAGPIAGACWLPSTLPWRSISHLPAAASSTVFTK